MTRFTYQQVADRLQIPLGTLKHHLTNAYRDRPSANWVCGRGTKHPRMTDRQILALEAFIWPEPSNIEAADFARQGLARGTVTGFGVGPSAGKESNCPAEQETAKKLRGLFEKHSTTSPGNKVVPIRSHSGT